MFCYGFNSGDLYVIASGDFCTSQCLAMNYRIFKLSLVKFTVNRRLVPKFHPTFCPGFLSAFCPRWGGKAKWDCMDCWRGKHIFMCKACGKVRGVGGLLPQGNFDFWPFIRHNLVELKSLYYWFTRKIEFSAYPRGGGGESQSQVGANAPPFPEGNPASTFQSLPPCFDEKWIGSENKAG